MGKYFGTDGFRGEANVGLTSAHAYKIGQYLGALAARSQVGTATATEAAGEVQPDAAAGERAHIVIGKDTRHSGDMFEMALAAGITAAGTDAYLLGVVTTPGVAYLTREGDFAFGVMISASHNPFQDNGIKVLNAQGEKLDEATIAGIESFIDGDPVAIELAQREGIGRVVDYAAACEAYARFLEEVVDCSFAGMKVALDCANGGAHALAPEIFEALGAQVTAVSVQPNGLNINVGCGSTHLDALCEVVREGEFDVGFAYDGDADRCLAVDAEGNCVDGDQIMYACACYLRDGGRLSNNTLVTTIMSNYGLYQALDAAGIAYEKTAVGDKYVYENMAANGHALGGEQSGHIIFRDYATTGDGMLTSLMVMEVMMSTGKTLAELVAPMHVLPQVLKNVRVADKAAALADEDVARAIAAAGEALEGVGRVLVRQSGTEPVIRVMAEAPDTQTCEREVDAIIAVMREKGHVVA